MRAALWLGLGAAYFAAAKLGLSLAVLHPSASSVWPPTGLALAAALAFGPGVWPGVFAGAFLANLTTAGTWATSLGIAAGNTGEALLGAWLVARFAGGRAALESPRGIVRFVLLAALLATTVSASAGVLSLALGGFAAWDRAAAIWLTWWLGDATGAMLVAPPLLLARSGGVRWDPERGAEAVLLTAALGLVGTSVFLLPPDPPLGFLCLPLVLWAAYRFGPREASLAALALSVIAVYGTVNASGPWGGSSGPANLAAMQAFFATLSVTGLILAALAGENRRAAGRLQAALAERSGSLEEATASLAQAYEELEAFSYTVSHDLRGPLRKIIGFGELLELEEAPRLGSAAREHLGRMRAAARSMAQLVDALLELARYGRHEVRRESVDAGALAREAAAELAEAQPARGVAFSCRLHGPVQADRRLLKVLLRNLLDNAWKFTAGVPEPRVEVGETSQDGLRWLYVRDNGAGFAREQAERLFAPFTRLHTSGEFPGLGIGLATVKRVARRHGGRVRAEGAPGEGATVYFSL